MYKRIFLLWLCALLRSGWGVGKGLTGGGENCILTEERACTAIVSQQETNIVIVNKCNLEYRRQ